MFLSRLCGIVTLPGFEGQVMFDGLGIDALIARHADLPDYGLALGMGIRPQHRRCQ